MAHSYAVYAMAETKSSGTGCSVGLGLIYCVALLVFMFQSDWLSGANPTFESFMRVTPIVMLASNMIIICCTACLIVCSAVKDGSGPLLLLPIIIFLYVVFSLAFYIAAAVFMFDMDNFTESVSDIYREILGISAIVFASFTGFAICVVICCIGVGVGTATNNPDAFSRV